MKFKIKKDKEIKYLKAKFNPRYFEDCEVDGVDLDPDNPLIPGYDEKKYITWVIDIDNGIILNWNSENVISKMSVTRVYFKVCDQGTYSLLDDDMKTVIASRDGYVPEILGQDDTSFGDYIYLTIMPDGSIKNWRVTNSMIKELQEIIYKCD